MTGEPYYTACSDKLTSFLGREYGIPVIIRDIQDPLTGDLDGMEIHVDYALGSEDRLFLIAHLFGHTVQWNVRPRLRHIGQPSSIPVPEAQMPRIVHYEREAAQYALSLFHRNGITDLNQWLTDYSACDIAYLAHYYRTGEKKDPKTFWKSGQPLLEAKPIPIFKPKRWRFRLNGIVI
jgi:hypothetical protein